MKKIILPILFLYGIALHCVADPPRTEIRIGVVAFGTVNWELVTMQQEGLDKTHNIRLNLRPLANSQAGKIALQARAVDMIVSDWIWVSRQRNAGSDFTFAPYSNTTGALVVPGDSTIETIRDLTGKRLGIAGGGLDKNWLLLRALALKQAQLDLDQSVEKVFAAPPLLNNQILQGNLDALINYWHYAVRLKAQGYKQIVDGHGILQGLGITKRVPSLGYVFREGWAKKNEAAVSSFLSASREAKNLLCSDDRAWRNIIHLTAIKQQQTQNLIRHHYCDGRIQHWGKPERKAAQRIFNLLLEYGGEKLTGKSTELEKGTFWKYQIDPL